MGRLRLREPAKQDIPSEPPAECRRRYALALLAATLLPPIARPATDDSLADVASAGPLLGKPRCNSGSADDSAQRTARTL